MSAKLARRHLLPAVKANTGLRKLNASEEWEEGYFIVDAPNAVYEAEDLVALRRYADGADA
jgi:hypothetical protein